MVTTDKTARHRVAWVDPDNVAGGSHSAAQNDHHQAISSKGFGSIASEKNLDSATHNSATNTSNLDQDYGGFGRFLKGIFNICLRILSDIVTLSFRGVQRSFLSLLPPVVLVAGLAVALFATILYLHAEINGAKHAVANFLGTVTGSAMFIPMKLYGSAVVTYCHFLGWGCPHSPPVEVVMGVIHQVGSAKDIFEMVTALGNAGTTALGTNHLQ